VPQERRLDVELVDVPRKRKVSTPPSTRVRGESVAVSFHPLNSPIPHLRAIGGGATQRRPGSFDVIALSRPGSDRVSHVSTLARRNDFPRPPIHSRVSASPSLQITTTVWVQEDDTMCVVPLIVAIHFHSAENTASNQVQGPVRAIRATSAHPDFHVRPFWNGSGRARYDVRAATCGRGLDGSGSHEEVSCLAAARGYALLAAARFQGNVSTVTGRLKLDSLLRCGHMAKGLLLIPPGPLFFPA
jgi:hypothetical protein